MSRDAEFDAYVTSSGPRLLRLAGLLGADSPEDVVQEALVRVYVAWARIGDPHPYATRAVVNEVRGRWRLRARRPETPTDEVIEVAQADRTSGVGDRDELARALAQLPRAQRQAVVLRHVEDLSEAETARLLGCSVGTVKSSTSRGLARLRELLTPTPTSPGGPS